MGKRKREVEWLVCNLSYGNISSKTWSFPPLHLCLLSLLPHWPFSLMFHSLALGSMPRERVLSSLKHLEEGCSALRVSGIRSLWNQGLLGWGLALPLLCVTLANDWIFYIYPIWNGDDHQNNSYLGGLGSLPELTHTAWSVLCLVHDIWMWIIGPLHYLSTLSSRYVANGNEASTSRRYLRSHDHGSIIPNSWDTETTQAFVTDEWIKKLWHIDTMEYHSALKNEILSFATIWMKLEDIMWSERNQSQQEKHFMIPLIYGIWKELNSWKLRVEWWLLGVWWRGWWGDAGQGVTYSQEVWRLRISPHVSSVPG